MFDVNLWAVLVAAIVSMVVGWLWYGVIFSKSWMRLMRLTPEQMEAGKKGMGRKMIIHFISLLVLSFVFGHFLNLGSVVDIASGLSLAFWVWLGFFATTDLGVVLWENKSWKLFFLNTVLSLVMLLLVSVVFVLFL